MASNFPRTMQRGPLKGQTFDSNADYLQALKEWREQNLTPEDLAEPTKRRRRTRKQPGDTGPVSLEMAEGLVAFCNMCLSIIPPTREDTLDDYEAKALALAIVDTAKTNKFFATMVIRVTTIGTQGRLAVTVGSIVAVRLAKREIVPLQVGAMAQMMLISMANTNPLPVPIEITDTESEQAPAENV